jgi:multidrug efflux system membrane fusion protein
VSGSRFNRVRSGVAVRLTAAVCLLLTAAACQPRNQLATPPPPKVTVALPLQQPVQEYFETTGRTAASQEVELRARVNGYLKEINFQDGDLVDAGKVLFVIDKAPYEATLASAAANKKRVEAQLVLAKQDYDRIEGLVKERATTQSVRDEVSAKWESAKADVDAAAAALQEAQLNLDYSEIRAPFAGRITEKMLDVGNLVQPGTSLLGRIQAVSPVYAYFTLSESDLLYFMHLQQSGQIKISDADPIEIELALGDSDQFVFKGRLDYREFGIDPATGTTQRRAVFENDDARLIPGLFVRIRARVGEAKEQLLVEERCLGADQRGDYLLVVNPKNVVELRTVKLGRREGAFRAIESGLNADDRVVTNGLQRARPGATVNPDVVVMGASTPGATTASAGPGATGGGVDEPVIEDAPTTAGPLPEGTPMSPAKPMTETPAATPTAEGAPPPTATETPVPAPMESKPAGDKPTGQEASVKKLGGFL